MTVFKVGGKMFALLSPPAKPTTISLKCEPTLAIVFRQKYKGVLPGYHLNKNHWNSVLLDGDVPKKEIYRMIDDSYGLVAKIKS